MEPFDASTLALSHMVAIPLVANYTEGLRRRRKAMHAQLDALHIARLSLHLPRASAQEGKDSIARLKARIGRVSTMMALEACAGQQRRFCLILEDDTRLRRDFLRELASTLKALPASWTALHLCPEFIWGGSQGAEATPFKLWKSYTDGPDDRFFASKWMATGGQWVGGPLAFVVTRAHATAMARPLRKQKPPLMRLQKQSDGSYNFTWHDRACHERNREGCSDDGTVCCDYEAVDMALAIHHQPGDYIARQPPLCTEDAASLGGTSFPRARFDT
jgi:hypothetical protein